MLLHKGHCSCMLKDPGLGPGKRNHRALGISLERMGICQDICLAASTSWQHTGLLPQTPYLAMQRNQASLRQQRMALQMVGSGPRGLDKSLTQAQNEVQGVAGIGVSFHRERADIDKVSRISQLLPLQKALLHLQRSLSLCHRLCSKAAFGFSQGNW